MITLPGGPWRIECRDLVLCEDVRAQDGSIASATTVFPDGTVVLHVEPAGIERPRVRMILAIPVPESEDPLAEVLDSGWLASQEGQP